MGAWDYGLLDNDTAQDWLGSFVAEIKRDVIEIHEQSSRKFAGNTSAAVGILLRLARGFDPFPGIADPPHFYPRLICALSANVKHFIDFPGNSPAILAAVLAGRGEELAERPGQLKKSIAKCLLGGELGVLQGSISVLEKDLFLHPSAKAYMKLKTKNLTKRIDEQLKDHDEVFEMSRSFLGGMLALPLLIPLVGLTPKKIKSWSATCEKVWTSKTADEETIDIQFARKYRRNVKAAFKQMTQMYSK